ncbi:MAG: hypothetical protein HOI95_27360, partial [Chromatiales bacterium]|nr:hypothetical protein [Chromatiales bacterium]
MNQISSPLQVGFKAGGRPSLTVADALLIAAVALAVRLVNVWFQAYDPTLFEVEDSVLYLSSARELLAHGAFLVDVGGALVPLTERVPLYPVILALIRLISETTLAAVLVQAMTDSVTCVLIAMLGTLVNSRVGRTAGLLAAVWPNMIIHSAQILTDSIFLLVLVSAMCVFAAVVNKSTFLRVMALGLLIGLAMMTRAAAQFAPPVIAVTIAYLVLRSGRQLFVAVALSCTFLVVVLAVISPITLRNLQDFDSLQLTSQGGTHLLFWVAPEVVHAAKGTPLQTVRDRFQEELQAAIDKRPDNTNLFVQSQLQVAVATAELKTLPIHSFVQAWLIGSLRTLITPAPLHDQRVRRLSNASFAGTSGSFLERVTRYITENSLAYRVVAILTIGAAVVMSVVQLLGFVICVRLA